jgi:hypothetical protein
MKSVAEVARGELMPVIDIHFENGIFFARERGRIEKEDARLWARHAVYYAYYSPLPIIALVDALEVSHISNEARKIFARASRIPKLEAAAVAARDVVTVQTARVISLMAEDNHTHIFSTLAQAHDYAEWRMWQIRGVAVR